MYSFLLEQSKYIPYYLPVIYVGLYLMSNQINYLIISGLVCGSMAINCILKYMFQLLYYLCNRDTLPILGIGRRPDTDSVLSDIELLISSQRFGMPSGHSQIIWTVIGYLIIWRYMTCVTIFQNPKIIIEIMIWLFIGIIVSYSRIEFGYHTYQQVIIGGIIGSLIGIISYFIIEIVIKKLMSNKV